MLEGKQVKLRAIERDDLPTLLQFRNDLEVELAGGGDPPEPQSLERIQKDFERGEREFGGIGFAIEADRKLIGQCGLFNVDETARHCELGVTIGNKSYWGRGYGREAVALLLDYAFRFRNFRRVWLEVNASNERAIRSYKACGFVEEGRLREHTFSNGRYVDVIQMGVLREEWHRG